MVKLLLLNILIELLIVRAHHINWGLYSFPFLFNEVVSDPKEA